MERDRERERLGVQSISRNNLPQLFDWSDPGREIGGLARVSLSREHCKCHMLNNRAHWISVQDSE